MSRFGDGVSNDPVIPRCRWVVFQDRDEALESAKQTASVHEGAEVKEKPFHIMAIQGEYVLLNARWFAEKRK